MLLAGALLNYTRLESQSQPILSAPHKLSVIAGLVKCSPQAEFQSFMNHGRC